MLIFFFLNKDQLANRTDHHFLIFKPLPLGGPNSPSSAQLSKAPRRSLSRRSLCLCHTPGAPVWNPAAEEPCAFGSGYFASCQVSTAGKHSQLITRLELTRGNSRPAISSPNVSARIEFQPEQEQADGDCEVLAPPNSGSILPDSHPAQPLGFQRLKVSRVLNSHV